MPTIQPFRGLRYDLGHVGSLSDVVTPPYDVISPAFQDELYKRHPANFIRLELNREEPGDIEQSNKYTRASRFLKQWRQEGVMQVDPDPALYVYHQTFQHEGKAVTRRGFMGRVRLERFGEGKIYPHEETHSGPKADRLNLTKACKANLSQIFGLYPDPQNEAQDLLEAAVAGQTPLEATDHLGVIHRMWPVTDVKVIADVAALMDAKPLFIADGHHRYETACNYRDLLAHERHLDTNHPAYFVLTQCVSMNDPGLLVLQRHNGETDRVRHLRAVPGCRGDQDHGSATRGDHFRESRRPGRWGSGDIRPDDRRDQADVTGHRDRGAHTGLQG